jgi:hypothetical protein
MIQAPQQDDPNYQISGLPQFGIPQGYGLPLNFGFPGQANPLGAFTDSGYLADDAALRADIGTKYAGILQQLGYTDPSTGNVIPGTVVQDANIKLANYLTDLQNEQIQNVQQMQQNGTLFSGIRPFLLSQAQSPTQQNIGQLQVDTSRSLNDLYNQAQGLVTSYNTQNQQNLAAAAARNLAAIQAQQLLDATRAANAGGGGGGGGSSDGGDGGYDVPDPSTSGGNGVTGFTPQISGQVSAASPKPIVINNQPQSSGSHVSVPVGYSGSGWNYPVGTTGKIAKY